MRTLNTKEGRLNNQKIQFNFLIEKGYKQEVYKDLNIFTMTDSDSTWLKIFRGTSTKEVIYKRYRTEDQSIEAIKNAKASHDRSLAYKAELKNNPKKSSSANCAAAIREELKKEFEKVKFSVKSSNFSGGDSVSIEWTDGPTSEQVDGVVKKYQYGHFNGMDDIYEYSNSREDIPQSKYVHTNREISDEVKNIVLESLRSFYSEDVEEYQLRQDCYRILYKNAIPSGAIVTGLETTGKNGLLEDFYKLTFEQTQEETKENTTFELVEVKEGQIQLIDYSEKSIAVIGDTKPIKEKLKELGGKFNFRLSCGAGWIFPKSKISEIEAIFN